MIKDASQRAEAINPEKSFIVQAPAGSGKTELLIQRYLKLLSLVAAPEEVVAITFTRKAAAEMRTRIINALERSADDVPALNQHQEITLALANQALEHSKKLEWNILENPSRLRIQTIDSLCVYLNRFMAFLSKMGGHTEITQEPRLLYEQAAINTIKRLESNTDWSADIRILLQYLDNDLPRLKLLLVEMLAKRDQWLRYVIEDHDRNDMESTLKLIIEKHLIKLSAVFPREYADELCELAVFATDQLKKTETRHKLVTCDSFQKLPGSKVSELSQWLAIRDLLLKKDGLWRKRINKKDGFPSPSENKAESEIRKSMKQRMEALLQQLTLMEELRELLAELDYLPGHGYEDGEWQIIGALKRILTLSEAELRVLFTQHNEIDFTGITQSAIHALGDDDTPTDLALYLDYQINHLLIDEYQDISINQYELIHRLIAGWTDDENKSVYLVGDPMQSIYRFREAEVSLYIKTWKEKRLNQISLIPLVLNSNFRSSESIVDWVNTQFTEIMPVEDDIDNGAVSFKPSIASNQTGNVDDIVIYPLLNNSEVEESNLIYKRVTHLLSSSNDESIAILVQSRTHLYRIIPKLKQHNIAYQAIDIDPLAKLSHVRDVMALTRAYIHFADRIAWLSILRAPWCGLKLKSLNTLFSHKPKQLIWNAIYDDSNIAMLDSDEKKILIRFRNIIEKYIKQKQRLSLRQTIESIWIALGGPATLENENYLEDIELFFSLLSDYELAGDVINIQDLENAVDKLFAKTNGDSGVRVQIMSMHKAKGLEFDHVIIPGLGKRTRVNPNELMMWSVKTGLPGQPLVMAPIKRVGDEDSPVFQYLKRQEQIKETFEQARLLYVASTRAKKSLTILAQANTKEDKNTGEISCVPESRSLLNHLWPNLKKEFDKKIQEHIQSSTPEELLMINQQLFRHACNWKTPEPDDEIMISEHKAESSNTDIVIEYLWAQKNIQYIGSTVHRFIQLIAEQGIKNWDKNIINKNYCRYEEYLKSLGMNNKNLNWAARRVADALSNFIEDERGQWILSDTHNDIENEFSLSGMYHDNLINIKIDRTFIDNNNIRWIIDYKTSRHEEADIETFLDQEKQRYQSQLERYATIVRQYDTQDSSRKIKLGLYFPLLQGWREWSV